MASRALLRSTALLSRTEKTECLEATSAPPEPSTLECEASRSEGSVSLVSRQAVLGYRGSRLAIMASSAIPKRPAQAVYTAKMTAVASALQVGLRSPDSRPCWLMLAQPAAPLFRRSRLPA